jgi:NAD(P)-dependent dehydrogenase (short-subunit alcohol dehydrogenase family)
LGITADGFETQFGTNHLGHFVLVNRVASLLQPGRRLVTLSSAGHRCADVDLNDPNFVKGDHDPWVAYGRSKTANILFAVELTGGTAPTTYALRQFILAGSILSSVDTGARMSGRR